MRIFNLILIIVINCGITLAENPDSVGVRIGVNTNKFKNILETIYWNYVDSADIDLISEEAFRAMLKTLDKNSVYFDKEQLYGRQVTFQGSEIGIGVEIKLINDSVVVYTVIEKSPADSAGIKPFDKILEIDGINLIGKSSEDIYRWMRGEKNTKLKLKIQKGFSSQILDLVLTRSEFTISSLNIALQIPETKVGYISSKNFSKISHFEFQRVIEKFLKSKINGLVIDLRDNPGGYLEQVSLIIDEFLVSGKTISYTEARNTTYKQTLTSTKGGSCEDLPLVLILNKNSASACELFAGVLQDFDRGLVIGQRSFGKSSVQRLWNMNDSTGFQLTVAEYFTPLGRSIDIKKKDSLSLDPALKLSLDDTTYNRISEMVNQFGVGSNLPVSLSENGRVLLGGGGIFPDYIVEEEQNTLLTNILQQRSIIFEYVYSFLSVNKNVLEKDFKNDMEKFIKNYKITDKMLIELKNYSYSKNIWNEEMFQKDKLKIKDILKATIGRALFGNSAYYGILIKNDKWIQKAVEVMPDLEIRK